MLESARSLLVALLLLPACASGVEAPATVSRTPAATTSELFDAYHDFKLRIHPVGATMLGEPGYDDQVADFVSDAYSADLVAGYSRFLEELASFDGGQVPLSVDAAAVSGEHR